MKITLKVEPEWSMKAAQLATSFAQKYGHEGRTKQRQCVVYDVEGVYFAAWGDTAHVRVQQAPLDGN
jgi:hypothetical protein